jgi:hypothetical protein
MPASSRGGKVDRKARISKATLYNWRKKYNAFIESLNGKFRQECLDAYGLRASTKM